MRKIYVENVEETQQGCIFNGAVADGFDGCTVYGLIITPRCDIAQRKVSTIHYLPIIKLDDWKREVLSAESQRDRLSKMVPNVLSLLKKYKIPEHLQDKKYKLSENDFKKVITDKRVYDAVFKPLNEYWNLQDIKKCYSSLREWNNYNNRMTDLADGKNERYLLIEKWNDEEQFYVICLTEIYHISIDTALNLYNGVWARDVDYEKNDLLKTEEKFKQYKIQAQLSSPFIEYVTQRLSNAFFRIGIDDWADRKLTIEKIK